jgi:hypothetical protein
MGKDQLAFMKEVYPQISCTLDPRRLKELGSLESVKIGAEGICGPKTSLEETI